ncbi:unnamed protein product, partial [Effrenium voratum]
QPSSAEPDRAEVGARGHRSAPFRLQFPGRGARRSCHPLLAQPRECRGRGCTGAEARRRLRAEHFHAQGPAGSDGYQQHPVSLLDTRRVAFAHQTLRPGELRGHHQGPCLHHGAGEEAAEGRKGVGPVMEPGVAVRF